MRTGIRHRVLPVLMVAGLASCVGLLSALLVSESVGLVLGISAAVVMLISLRVSPRLVARALKARPLEWESIKDLIPQRAPMPDSVRPGFYLVRDPSPNAFSWGSLERGAGIFLTSGLMEHLESRMIRGVIAHELAHLSYRDTIISDLLSCISLPFIWWLVLARVINRKLSAGGTLQEHLIRPIDRILAMALAPIPLILWRAGLPRFSEFNADVRGAGYLEDPSDLADALEALEGFVAARPSSRLLAITTHHFVFPYEFSGIWEFFCTHPPVKDRARRLRELVRLRRGSSAL